MYKPQQLLFTENKFKKVEHFMLPQKWHFIDICLFTFLSRFLL